jgi:SNF2 family DNA or RNA helicase
MSVLSHTDGKRILLKFDYDRDLVARVKSVPGARWHADTKTWRVPLTMDTCRYLRKVFGDQLLVSNELAAWASSEIGRVEKLEDLREGWDKTSSNSLDRVAKEAPDLYAAMNNRPYQLAGAAFGVKAGQSILADDPGLGKTLQALAMIIQSDAKRILVACRRTATRSVWELETMRWAPTTDPCVAQGDRAFRQEMMDYFPHSPSPRRMLIINIEMLQAKRIVICPQGLGDKCPAYKVGQCWHTYEAEYKWPWLFEQEWDAIIVDESHNLLASTANYQSKRITQGRYGAVQIRRRLRPGGLALAISGTPFRSDLTKGWGTLNWLRPDVFTSFWNWAGIHFGVDQGGYGGSNRVAGGAKVPEPLDQAAWDAMLRPYYLRREKPEVAKDLPPVIYAGTPIDPDIPDSPCYIQLDMLDENGKDTKQRNAYQDMVEDSEADIEGGRIMATGVLAEITRQRQLANAYGHLDSRNEMSPALPSNKIDWILDFVQMRESTGLKVVIASDFTEMVEFTAAMIRKELGIEVLTLTGATSDRNRAGLVARFQDFNDDLRVVCINRKAGGESITLDAADDMVIIDQPWISDTDDQLIPRIHRVSRIHQVTVYRLVSIGTIDFWMAGLTDEQRRVLATASPQKLSKLIKEASQ